MNYIFSGVRKPDIKIFANNQDQLNDIMKTAISKLVPGRPEHRSIEKGYQLCKWKGLDMYTEKGIKLEEKYPEE